MSDIDVLFDKINFASKIDKPISDFSNWILSISIGLCLYFLERFNMVQSSNCDLFTIIYFFIVSLNMFNLLISGIVKYQIIMREILMNQSVGGLNKEKFFLLRKEKTDINKLSSVVDKYMNDWAEANNKINVIGKKIKILIVTTLLSVICSGAFLISLYIYLS